MIILSLKITAIFISIVICFYYGRREKKAVRKFPQAGDPLECYDADFVQLAYNIEKAQTLRQLDYARKYIDVFKSRYVAYKEPVQLQIDINKLRRQYKEQRTAVSIRMQLFN